MIASAPGKLMLAGEYAVLHGHPGWALAVDRRVTVRARRPGEPVRPLPIEARAAWDIALREGVIASAPDGDAVVVDVSALSEGDRKLGLGSSAAGCVAALAWAMAREGRAPRSGDDRRRVALLARRAHREAQGGGSGLDVLCSSLGGVVGARFADGAGGDVELLSGRWPEGLAWCALGSGIAVRTSEMLSAVRGLEGRDRGLHDGLMANVAGAARRMAAALEAGDVGATLRSVSEHCEAMRALGEAAGVAVVTDALRRLGGLIAPLGAAVKPSGAGGGDVSLLVAQDRAALDAAATAARELGFVALTLRPDALGVTVAEEDEG